MKNTPSQLVSGLGMGMQFLQKLTEAIIKNGGYPEMLYTLCTPHPVSAESLDQIGKLIAAAKWPVPRSLLEQLSYERTTSGGRTMHEYVEEDRMWFWSSQIDLLGEFGIPVTKFSVNGEYPHPPEELVKQFVGRQLTHSMQVMWKGEPHVLVDGISGEEGRIIKPCEFESGCFFAIAPANRIDFNH